MEKFIIACVLYNETINNIASLDAFRELKQRHKNVVIIIVDNSEDYAIKRESALQHKDLIYIDNHGNKGLSNAYNKVLVEFERENYWLMLADDDTEFSLTYLENVYEAAKSGETNIISGIITTKEGILSPKKHNYIFSRRNSYINMPGIYDDVYCINSGLTINKCIFDAIGKFDESLFLDMIDYWFMDSLKEKNLNRIKIVSGEVKQSFSGREQAAIETMRKRFEIYKKDFKRYCKLTRKSFFYSMTVLGKRTIKIMIASWEAKL